MEFHLKDNGRTQCVIPAGYLNRAAKRLIKRGKGWKVPGYWQWLKQQTLNGGGK